MYYKMAATDIMLKQCNIIEFLNVEGEIRIRIYERLKNVFGDATVGPLLW